MDNKLLLSRGTPVATRREKYNKLRRIHYTTINDPYTRSKDIIRTTYNVKKTIIQLDKELGELAQLPQHPNQLLTSKELETIKISSRIFSKIINDSPVTYKQDLIKIKRFYDNRLDELLRSMNEIVSRPHPSTHDYLKDVKISVLELEKQLLSENEENKRLQNEWRLCQSSCSTLPVRTDSNNNNNKDNFSDYATRVDNKQRQIYQRHKQICDSLESREGLVPYTVCQRIEQCIRSSELEIQKLSKINNQLQRDIQSIEVRLRQYLEAVHTPPNHVIMLWKKFEKKAEHYTTSIAQNY